jgi:hypothetical protein
LGVNVGDDDPGAFLGQCMRRFGTDAASRTGDDGHLAF